MDDMAKASEETSLAKNHKAVNRVHIMESLEVQTNQTGYFMIDTLQKTLRKYRG
jgi:hypothetical protein